MRIIGYVFGFYMLFNALMTTIMPQQWTKFTARPAERILPPDQAAVVHEFTRLSPRALRFGALVESGLGLLVLALASRRSRATSH